MTMKPLPQNYDHKQAEARLQQQWEDVQVYAWDSTQPRENTYVIDTPPPTVSGHLHMGHIFSYTQADFVARFQRMRGKTVFYPMGFDDNGLPTERLVEKMRGKKATQYESREAFIAVCNEVSAEARKDFRKLFTSVALSVDWAQEYHTISDHARRLSQMSFIDLYNKNKAYRQLQPMLWDPVDQTAIAQAEIVDAEKPSHFNYITFGLEGAEAKTLPAAAEESDIAALARETLAQGKLLIGTTRPELLPACVAVFVHPEDARYAHLVGKTAITPLFGVKVDILADEKVQMDKGTGAVMCCTFGDETDIHWWKTYQLKTRIILNKYAKIDLSGLDVAMPAALAEIITAKKAEDARKILLEKLSETGLLKRQDAITHTVKTAERSGAVLELLPTQQWFVKVLEAKDALKEKSRACEWHPEWMAHRMEQWIDGLSWDWCISRQRYFGVPFPVWYIYQLEEPFDSIRSKRRENGDYEIVGRESDEIIIAPESALPVNPISTFPKWRFDDGVRVDPIRPGEWLVDLGGNKGCWLVKADIDVMDTWATSSISPQISAGAITPELGGDADRYAKLYPADLRPQAHEIIRTWAFYTLVKSHHHANSIPWKNLMISGWCLAEDKSKMSKSKGNVITPVELIEEFSADVVRYWASTSRLGADTAFSKDLLKIGKKLVNKLWNATKFAAIQLESLSITPAATAAGDDARITAALDRWIITRLHRAMEKATAAFETYEYANARAALEDFFWNDFCDQYLELVKARAYDADGTDAAGKQSAQLAIYHCLDGILRGFAPFLPHVTEELWSHIFADRFAAKGSIHARGNWPKADEYFADATAEASGFAAVDVLNAIRKAKSERAVSIKFPISHATVAAAGEGATWAALQPVATDVAAAGNVLALAWSETPVEATVHSETGAYALALTFAEAAEVA